MCAGRENTCVETKKRNQVCRNKNKTENYEEYHENHSNEKR